MGSKDNLDNQIQAFYNDLNRYIDWYTNPATNGNIPSDMSLGEYAATKHHDGINYTNFENAPGRQRYNRDINGAQPEELNVGSGWPYPGSLVVNPELYVEGSPAEEIDSAGCIKFDENNVVYIDYFLERLLTSSQREEIVLIDPTNAFYIMD